MKFWKERKELFLAQCKRWECQTVGVKIVRELAGAVVLESATGGAVVASERGG